MRGEMLHTALVSSRFRVPRWIYRFVYCGALRARLSPTFLRSFSRASRVSNFARLRVGRSSASKRVSARATPWRIAKQLLSLADERGVQTRNGVRIDLRLSQTELASIVGTTRESVNRCLNAFADRGYLVIDRDAITIRDRNGLQGRIY